MKLDVKVVNKSFSPSKIIRQIRFGTAVGLTKTAQAAQKAVVDKLHDSFTIRNRWFEKGNRYGIKIKAAKPATMEAQVHTLADWLNLHEEGGTKTPRNRFVAVPTENVRRSKKGIIRKNQRPRNLVNSFLLTSKEGNTILYQRKGKGRKSQLKAMYVMVPRAQITKAGTFYAAAMEEVSRVKDETIYAEIGKALANMK